MRKQSKHSGMIQARQDPTHLEHATLSTCEVGPDDKHSWKRRFFVLYKAPENDYQLRYYKSAEDQVSPLGGIDMTQISLLYENPQHHQKWQWVQKNFKCSPSCVVYLRAGGRDYFLIGETSTEAEGWFADLFEAMKNRSQKLLTSEIISNPLHRRKFSAPELKVRLYRKSGSFGEVKMGHLILMGAKKANSGPSKNPSLGLVESSVKLRSFSDPSSNAAEGNAEELGEDHSKRPISQPVNSDYDYPNNREVEVIGNSTLMRSITDIYIKYNSPPPTLNEASAENGIQKIKRRLGFLTYMENAVRDAKPHPEHAMKHDGKIKQKQTAAMLRCSKLVALLPCNKKVIGLNPNPEGFLHVTTAKTQNFTKEDKRGSSDFSASSSGAVSPVNVLETNSERRGSTRSLERDFMVNLQGLKNDLTLTEVEGKPRFVNTLRHHRSKNKIATHNMADELTCRCGAYASDIHSLKHFSMAFLLDQLPTFTVGMIFRGWSHWTKRFSSRKLLCSLYGIPNLEHEEK
ncbi:hypothetical protein CCH79_00003037 [Gambusia affinis]|uniref:PH domain-containing protein n=1 Tax=Gambusia affinis TaxID=33528 RepID=A0A315VE10_GAMAF|nr:hypothetical protein CCH79_00003037 [Gambusia affinis]